MLLSGALLLSLYWHWHILLAGWDTQHRRQQVLARFLPFEHGYCAPGNRCYKHGSGRKHTGRDTDRHSSFSTCEWRLCDGQPIWAVFPGSYDATGALVTVQDSGTGSIPSTIQRAALVTASFHKLDSRPSTSWMSRSRTRGKSSNSVRILHHTAM